MLSGSFLGIDTSNYTTSAALLQCGEVRQSKKLLPVENGQLGLRQSDALFHHTKQLPQVLAPLLPNRFDAIGVSDRPRNIESSYMPCFLAGLSAAELLAASMSIPLYRFSHQEGHIAAALYSAGKLSLLEEPFLAFHLSGGTSEGLLVEKGENGRPSIRIISKTLDISAGQAIDRVGLMLGLSFPAGKQLEELAKTASSQLPCKPAVKGRDFSLSGLENKCLKMLADGFPKPEIAAFCLTYIISTIDKITKAQVLEFGNLPILFSGGVSSNSLMRDKLTEKYGAYFAAPEFSADNGAGVAVLAAMQKRGGL